eukprot:4179903-Amphidinium_carterae.2
MMVLRTKEFDESFHAEVSQLSCRRCKLDPCVYSWFHEGRCKGIFGVTVDDMVCGGTPLFRSSVLDRLSKRFPFGKLCEGQPRFTGRDLVQDEHGNITISQVEYVKSLEQVYTPRAKRQDKRALLSPMELTVLRGKVGELKWVQGRATSTRSSSKAGKTSTRAGGTRKVGGTAKAGCCKTKEKEAAEKAAKERRKQQVPAKQERDRREKEERERTEEREKERQVAEKAATETRQKREAAAKQERDRRLKTASQRSEKWVKKAAAKAATEKEDAESAAKERREQEAAATQEREHREKKEHVQGVGRKKKGGNSKAGKREPRKEQRTEIGRKRRKSRLRSRQRKRRLLQCCYAVATVAKEKRAQETAAKQERDRREREGIYKQLCMF